MPTRRWPASCSSRSRPSRRTCRACSASSSCHRGTSSPAGRRTVGSSDGSWLASVGAMDILHEILVFLHLIGFAALFGGLFVQLRSDARVVNAAMFHGILTQVLTGLLIVGVLEGMDEGPDNVKVGVKLLVAVVIAVLVVANR